MSWKIKTVLEGKNWKQLRKISNYRKNSLKKNMPSVKDWQKDIKKKRRKAEEKKKNLLGTVSH